MHSYTQAALAGEWTNETYNCGRLEPVLSRAQRQQNIEIALVDLLMVRGGRDPLVAQIMKLYVEAEESAEKAAKK